MWIKKMKEILKLVAMLPNDICGVFVCKLVLLVHKMYFIYKELQTGPSCSCSRCTSFCHMNCYVFSQRLQDSVMFFLTKKQDTLTSNCDSAFCCAHHLRISSTIN